MTSINKRFKDFFGRPVLIYADETGWSILWADYSSDHDEREDTAVAGAA